MGFTRSHHRFGGDLCVMKAAEKVFIHVAYRFHLERHLPLCRWADGSPSTREQIQATLDRAAVAEGLPPNRFRSHSLRIGGATVLYHIYHDVEIIKRYGRSSSSTFQGDLWEANETAQGVGEKMAANNATIHFDPS